MGWATGREWGGGVSLERGGKGSGNTSGVQKRPGLFFAFASRRVVFFRFSCSSGLFCVFVPLPVWLLIVFQGPYTHQGTSGLYMYKSEERKGELKLTYRLVIIIMVPMHALDRNRTPQIRTHAPRARELKRSTPPAKTQRTQQTMLSTTFPFPAAAIY